MDERRIPDPPQYTKIVARARIVRLIVIVFWNLSLLLLVAGILAIVFNEYSETKPKFNIVGFDITMEHVGVALVGIGLVTGYLTMRAVLRYLKELAAPDTSQRRSSEPKHHD